MRTLLRILVLPAGVIFQRNGARERCRSARSSCEALCSLTSWSSSGASIVISFPCLFDGFSLDYISISRDSEVGFSNRNSFVNLLFLTSCRGSRCAFCSCCFAEPLLLDRTTLLTSRSKQADVSSVWGSSTWTADDDSAVDFVVTLAPSGMIQERSASYVLGAALRSKCGRVSEL
jgi:hypothetical protein